MTSPRPGQSSFAQPAGARGNDEEFLQHEFATHLRAARGPGSALDACPGDLRACHCRQVETGPPSRGVGFARVASLSSGVEQGCQAGRGGATSVSTARRLRHFCTSALSFHRPCPFRSQLILRSRSERGDWQAWDPLPAPLERWQRLFPQGTARWVSAQTARPAQGLGWGLKPLFLPTPISCQEFGKTELTPDADCTSISRTFFTLESNPPAWGAAPAAQGLRFRRPTRVQALALGPAPRA